MKWSQTAYIYGIHNGHERQEVKISQRAAHLTGMALGLLAWTIGMGAIMYLALLG